MLFVRMTAGREGERVAHFFVCLRGFDFAAAGGGEGDFQRHFTFGGGAFGMHASGPRSLVHWISLFLSFRRSIFLERGRGVIFLPAL